MTNTVYELVDVLRTQIQAIIILVKILFNDSDYGPDDYQSFAFVQVIQPTLRSLKTLSGSETHKLNAF